VAFGTAVNEEALLAEVHRKLPGTPEELACGFVRHLESKGYSAVEQLDSAHLADLLLAFECLEQRPAALLRLRERITRALREVGAKLKLSADAADEIRSLIEESFVVRAAEARPPGAERYTGRGSLDSLLRAMAVRVALRQRDRHKRELPLASSDLEQLGPALGDPSLELMRARYRAAFQSALTSAVESLSARERNVLRLYVLEGLSVDRIGVAYQVHRSTVSRWLSASRERLLQRTRESLMTALGVPPDDVDSLIRILSSRLELSLSRLLR
jgi:RNA polymerase sigma-70 factor, ECF subfamily